MIRRAALALLFVTACGPHKDGAAPKPQPTAGTGPALAFEVDDGDIRNYFFQQGPVSAHVLASSGTTPRLIVAFPAGNTGAAVWFQPVTTPTKFEVTGGLQPMDQGNGLRGVAMQLVATGDRLEVRGAVLGSIRTIRDYQALGTKPPETEHETLAGSAVVMKRVTADGVHHVQLSLTPSQGTTVSAAGGKVTIIGSGGAIHLQAVALSDEPALTPIGIDHLLAPGLQGNPRDLRALAFLAYKEKLLAGSWRFLTYFGRDTLLSVRLMMTALDPEVVEAALGAVLERLQGDGDVAHEEDIGDFAALRHLKDATKPADMEQPIFDYKMIDDDFLLAPVLAMYLLDTDTGVKRAKAFLSRTTRSGVSYAALVQRNLELVMKRATPYAAGPSATTLVALKPGIPVGQWRDSEHGIGDGRFAFDVNVALVPAALAAAKRLYDSGTITAPVGVADQVYWIASKWQDVASRFRVEQSATEAAAHVKDYATGLGLDPAEAVASLRGPLVFDAISLDAAGKPLPIMHTDDGFVLLFGTPSPEYLTQVAGELVRPFPAGLRTPVGMVVANPAFAADAKLRGLFTREAYHGTVVWSWQQAMLAVGLARQIARSDLPPDTRKVLVEAESALWSVIEAMSAQSAGELWTWDVKDRAIHYVPFGQGTGHVDESNAVQLWSTVYLGVRRPQR